MMEHPQDRENMLDELLSQGAPPTEPEPQPITDLVKDSGIVDVLLYLSVCSRVGINPVMSGDPPRIFLHQSLYEQAVAMRRDGATLNFYTNQKGDLEISETDPMQRAVKNNPGVADHLVGPLTEANPFRPENQAPVYEKVGMGYKYTTDNSATWTIKTTDSTLSADEWYHSQPEYSEQELSDSEQ